MLTSTVEQTLLNSLTRTVKRHEPQSKKDIETSLSLLSKQGTGPIGVSIAVKSDGKSASVALSRGDVVVLMPSSLRGAGKAIGDWLSENTGKAVGFNFERIAAVFRSTFDRDISGHDILRLPWKGDSVWSPGYAAKAIYPGTNTFGVNKLWQSVVCSKGGIDRESLVLRAWVTSALASKAHSSVQGGLADTANVAKEEIDILAALVLEIELVVRAKPVSRPAEYLKLEATKTGRGVSIENSRYKTKMRHDRETSIILKCQGGRNVPTRTIGSKGRATEISATANPSTIKGIKIVGKESRNAAEAALDNTILSVLQGGRKLKDSAFIKDIWFSSEILPSTVAVSYIEGLNTSQANVVAAMTGSTDRLVLVHGGPGTGKTTTISAACLVWAGRKKGTWVVADSNVAVRNIALSLNKRKIPFRIVVSHEYYLEWHEHQYMDINESALVVSADLAIWKPREVDMMFDGVHVILCTLSMLSNKNLQKIFNKIRMENLVVDEASQISVFNYWPVLLARRPTLAKFCLFGDPNQLPPHDIDAAPDLKAIFDFPHIVKNGYFLDTQYRLPTPLGTFISKHVYGGRLKSHHQITNHACVRFVDIANGKEEKKGTSWINQKEVHCILELVEKYYHGENFCILTAYDAQRNAIANELKANGLPWENVFNVDSFQGNEADHVLISVVRTEKTGFLKSQNRVNVMLTRCKKGMVIVSQRKFLTEVPEAKETLIGQICSEWEDEYGADKCWIYRLQILNKTASLPVNAKRARPSVVASSI